jgi:predicted TIM-barrel fold metal-dependent hydrolase
MAAGIMADRPDLRLCLVQGLNDLPNDPRFVRLEDLLSRTPEADRQALAAIRIDPTDPALFLLSGGTTGIPKLIPRTPCGNDYVAALRDRHPGVFIQAWGAVDPLKGSAAVAEAVAAVRDHHVLGFHFHPIMGHFAVDEPALNPLFETIAGLRVSVMIDVGTTGMGAGLPGGLGARLEHARPLTIDNLAAASRR